MVENMLRYTRMSMTRNNEVAGVLNLVAGVYSNYLSGLPVRAL